MPGRDSPNSTLVRRRPDHERSRDTVRVHSKRPWGISGTGRLAGVAFFRLNMDRLAVHRQRLGERNSV